MTTTKEIQIDDLQFEMTNIHRRMTTTMKKIEVASQLVTDLNHRLWKDKIVFEKLDRELAMIDGRYVKVKHVAKKEEKTINGLKMTREQILELAKQLGVEVDI